MKTITTWGTALALAWLVAPSGAVAAPVAKVLTFSGTLRAASGAAEILKQNVTFRLYDTLDGGVPLYEEALSVQPGADGSFSVKIGSTRTLAPALFAQQLYLAIQVQGEPEMAPRTQLTPTPYTWTVDWSSVGGLPGPCPAGQFVTGLGPALTCSAPPQAVASVAGNGVIEVTTASGAVTISLATTGCVLGQVLRFGALGWGCEALPASVSSITASPPLTGGGSGAAAIGLMPCAVGQILKAGALGWQCGADAVGGTDGLTSVSHDGSLVGYGTSAAPLGLVTCAPGQILKTGGSVTSPVWGCAADADTIVGFLPADPTGAAGSALTAARSDHAHSTTLPLALSDARVGGTSATFVDVTFGSIQARALAILPSAAASWFPQLGFSPTLAPKSITVSITTVITGPSPARIPRLAVSANLMDAGASTGCSLASPAETSVPPSPPSVFVAGQSAVLTSAFAITPACVPHDGATLVVQIANNDSHSPAGGHPIVNAAARVEF
ncbi:MAG: hypothetical protein WCC48_05160 [Anaeromyxobacteraceae bacterium]